MSTALTLYAIEDELRALVDTLEGGVEEDQRLAILDEIGQQTELAVKKRDNLIRFLRHLDLSVYAADQEIARIKALRNTWETARERIARYVVGVIEQFAPEPKRGTKKLDGTLGVLALHKNPDRVSDEIDFATLPLEYQDVTVTLPVAVWEQVLAVLPDSVMDNRPTYTARKREILRDLKAGKDVPGADLVYGINRLEIR